MNDYYNMAEEVSKRRTARKAHLAECKMDGYEIGKLGMAASMLKYENDTEEFISAYEGWRYGFHEFVYVQAKKNKTEPATQMIVMEDRNARIS